MINRGWNLNSMSSTNITKPSILCQTTIKKWSIQEKRYRKTEILKSQYLSEFLAIRCFSNLQHMGHAAPKKCILLARWVKAGCFGETPPYPGRSLKLLPAYPPGGEEKGAAPPDLNLIPGASCGSGYDGCSPTLGAAMHCPLCSMFSKAIAISEAMHGRPFREIPRTSGRQPLLVHLRSSSFTPVLYAPTDEGAARTAGTDPLSAFYFEPEVRLLAWWQRHHHRPHASSSI
jgi:hypothetical protein